MNEVCLCEVFPWPPATWQILSKASEQETHQNIENVQKKHAASDPTNLDRTQQITDSNLLKASTSFELYTNAVCRAKQEATAMTVMSPFQPSNHRSASRVRREWAGVPTTEFKKCIFD